MTRKDIAAVQFSTGPQRRQFLGMALGSIAMLGLGNACGRAESGSSSAAPSATSSMSPDYRAYLDKLIEGAKSEGRLVIYSTSTVEPGQRTDGQRVKEMYDWLDVEEVIESSGSRLLERMNLEIQNGRVPDIADFGSTQLTDLRTRDLLQEYASPLADTFVDEYKPPHDYYQTTGFRSIHVIYNTNVVTDSDLPTDGYDLLLDPEFKGLIGLDIGSTFWEFWVALETQLGEQGAVDFLRELGATDPRPYFSNSQIRNLVASGELAFGIYIYLDNIITMQEQGAPIGIWNADPVGYNPSSNGILADAPHPNASKLYVETMLSPELQLDLSEEQYVAPIRADVPNPHPEYFQDVPFVVVEDVDLEENIERYRRQFEEFFRVEPVPES